MIYGIKIDKFRSCGGKYNEIREIKREDIPDMRRFDYKEFYDSGK